ncbi:MAG TPA: carbohydrate kinase [Trichocoleus sp.]
MSGNVVCLGECWIERLFGEPDPSGNPLANWQDFPSGAPANVATALVKLGTRASFVGCLGQDLPGQRLIHELRQAGVQCDAFQRHATAPTRIVLVMRDGQGKRQFVGFHLPDPAGFADAHLSTKDLSEAVFAQASYLVMGTVGLAYAETGAAIQQALTWAQQYGLTTAVDVNWRPAFWPEPEAAAQRILPLLAQVDLLKLSLEEAQWLFQTEHPATILQRLPQLKAVVITAGAQGCRYAAGSIQGALPAFEVDSEDTTGAGDAFLAGLIHQLTKQGLESLQDAAALQQIIRYASAVGALTTLRLGAIAAQPRANEVEAFLYLHPLP